MSTFCGILERDGAPANRDSILRMTAALQRGGPDSTGVWQGRTAGLAHCMLHTTVESLREVQPSRDEESGLIITGDVRIDNRPELLSQLGLAGPVESAPTDITLALLAFRKWGRDCVDQLLGDFAFAILDPERRELFCVRDHVGVKPYYFASVGQSFLFASEIKGLLAEGRVAKTLDTERLRRQITGETPRHDGTFYRGIFRLPAAHWMAVSPERVICQRYWQPDAERETPPRSDEECAEEFRALFVEAVRCRLRSAFPIGAHLSGGLDSSSIACVARDLARRENGAPLKTFTNRFARIPICDESGYAKNVLATGGFEPTWVDLDCSGPFSAIENHFGYEEEAVYSWGTYLADRLFGAAAEAGVRVCLDGFDGDTVVSHGELRFGELAAAGKWSEFAHEAVAAERLVPGVTAAGIFAEQSQTALHHFAAEGEWRKLFNAARAGERLFALNPWRICYQHAVAPKIPAPIRRLWRKARRKGVAAPTSRSSALGLFRPEALAALGCSEHDPEAVKATPFRNVRQGQCANLTSSLFTFDLELSARMQARHGIESRHPFLDKRLIEFCLALPSRQKLRHGFGRAILRNALRGVVPDEVLWRPNKTSYRPALVWTTLTYDMDALERCVQASGSLNRLVDTKHIRERLSAFRAQSSAGQRELGALWETLSLAHWLERTGFAEALAPPICNRS